MYTHIRNYSDYISKINQLISAKQPFSVAMVDLDHLFQKLGGRRPGDVLQEVYDSLQDDLGQELTYLGRDEIGILSTDKRSEDLFMLLSIAKQKVSQKFNLSFCAGVAEYPKHGEDAIELLRHLEEAVYQGKQTGRDRVSFADETKMKLKSNYYTLPQLNRLSRLSKSLGRSEASLLRESLDELFRKYEK